MIDLLNLFLPWLKYTCIWKCNKIQRFTLSSSCLLSQVLTEENFFSQNVADIKKLKSVGICTIKGIQMTTRRALCNVKGLSEAKVDKIKEAANKLIVSQSLS